MELNQQTDCLFNIKKFPHTQIIPNPAGSDWQTAPDPYNLSDSDLLSGGFPESVSIQLPETGLTGMI